MCEEQEVLPCVAARDWLAGLSRVPSLLTEQPGLFIAVSLIKGKHNKPLIRLCI